MMDALMSIPTLILAMAVMAALGQSLLNIVIAIGIVQIPRANRIVRSQVLAVKESQYVEGARAIGAGNMRIMVQHITPQCVAPWLIISTSALGIAILTEATLSFLGLGVPPPELDDRRDLDTRIASCWSFRLARSISLSPSIR